MRRPPGLKTVAPCRALSRGTSGAPDLTTIRPDLGCRGSTTMTSLPQILLDLDAWDAATSEERRSAEMTATDGLPDGFTFDRLETHALGGQAHAVALLRFEGAMFALLPGRISAPLGYDRSRPFVPTA